MSALVKCQPKLPARYYAQAGLLKNPVSAALSASVICIGAGLAGLVGGLSAVVALGSLAFVATRFDVVREALENRALRIAREELLMQRLKCMDEGGCGTPIRHQSLRDLSSKVNEIEDTDPGLAERFELQGLLDHFVAVAINYSKALDALRLAGNDAQWYASSVSPIKRSIKERRAAHRDRLNELTVKLCQRLDEIEELILLVAQRAAYAKVDMERDSEIERRLNELDEVEAAFNQLSEQA